MTPLTLSHFWQRRIYEVAFLLCLAIIGLSAVPYVTDIPAVDIFAISFPVAVLAAVTALLSLVFYLLKRKEPSTYQPVIIYLSLAVTVGLLIVQTGGLSSPFIALWMLLAFFSGVFAIWGILPLFIATGVYVAILYLEGGLSVSVITLIGFISIIPSIISLLVWRRGEGLDESTRNVRTLTNQLSEVASKSEIVINAIGDGVVAIDSVGVVQLINPAAQSILGWGKQDALQLNYKSVLPMLDANNHEVDSSHDPVFEVLNTNQMVRSKEINVKTKSGKKIVVSMVVSPIGEVGSGVIAVFRDVTKETAEEREQAEFISTASHEMRTPVASIEGYLGLALNANTATVDVRARDFILKAHEAAQHLGRLFQDLLDVSKSEDGRLTNNPKVLELSNFTETIVQGLLPKAQEKGLILTYIPSSQRAQRTLVPVYFVNQDNDHIREILNNLIENAIKYTPQGEVQVNIDGTEDKVIVSIKDTGLGIPTEDMPHLFQKFYRVDNVDRQQIGGTGLGLYLSRRLAEAMQGRLWAESVYGQGSTFFLELPRIDTEEAERLKLQQANQAQPNPTPIAFPTTRVSVNHDQVPADAVVTPPAQLPITQPAPQPAPSVAPATNVPRGQSLTPEQIAERVRELEALAQRTQASAQPTAQPSAQPAPQPAPQPPQPPAGQGQA